jgi:hypothetical protein
MTTGDIFTNPSGVVTQTGQAGIEQLFGWATLTC